MNNNNLNKFIEKVIAIENQEAKDAGFLGYMGRALVQATIPHRKIEGNEFIRTNGNFRLTILASSEIGLPYGSIPRLLLAWLATEAVRTKSRHLETGSNMSQFMNALYLRPTGGARGTITALKDQALRLFSASISCSYTNGNVWAIKNVAPVSQANFWLKSKDLDNNSSWESTVTLTEEFFNEIVSSPVPIDLRVLQLLRKSPLAIDIYCWVTHRVSYLKKAITISWEALQTQFGSDYPQDAQGLRNFKKHFAKELHKVVTAYGNLNIELTSNGLILRPCLTHIRMASYS